jgi:hypothetical protein
MPEYLQCSAAPGFRSGVRHVAGGSGGAVQHASARGMLGDDKRMQPAQERAGDTQTLAMKHRVWIFDNRGKT